MVLLDDSDASRADVTAAHRRAAQHTVRDCLAIDINGESKFADVAAEATDKRVQAVYADGDSSIRFLVTSDAHLCALRLTATFVQHVLGAR